MESPLETEKIVPTNKFSFDCELEITKKRGWVDSQIFHSNCVPGVDFRISAYINYRSTHMNIKITKSQTKDAAAIIEMSISKMPSIFYDITKWTETSYFNDLPLPIHSDKCPKIGLRCNLDNFEEHKYSVEISCTITWLGFIDDYCYSQSVFQKIQKFCTLKSSDIILKVQDTNFLAHKILLRTESEVIREMLNQNDKEKENCIHLPDLEIDVIEELLTFLYYGKLTKALISEELMVRLFKAASAYEFSKLKYTCAFTLSNNLTIRNVLKMINTGNLYNSPLLKERAVAFLKNNRSDILFSTT